MLLTGRAEYGDLYRDTRRSKEVRQWKSLLETKEGIL